MCIRDRRDTRARMLGLRADMDALPMVESNEFAWKSCKSGLMPVSYTHLDVYKRQCMVWLTSTLVPTALVAFPTPW